MGWKTLPTIVVGGGIGTIIRYELTVSFAPATPPDFDWLTLTINVIASFSLAAVVTLLVTTWTDTTLVVPFMAVGVIGGFSTWAHFIVETDQLVGEGQLGSAVAYVVASIMLGLLAAALGVVLAERASHRLRWRAR
jgi:fluoride exporter